MNAAVKNGDTATASKLLIEQAFSLPPGGFSRYDAEFQRVVLDNARTLTLTPTSLPPITCDVLAKNRVPTWLPLSSTNADTLTGIVAKRVAACMGAGTATITVLAGSTTHGAPIEHPDVFNRALLGFLDSVRGQQPRASVALTEKAIAINGINIRYVEQGQGEPVVFVHGGTADLRAWKMQRDAIAARYRFISYSRRYHGSEPFADAGEQFSASVDADDLVGFVREIGYGPVHVVTWSNGGLRATLAAVASRAVSINHALRAGWKTGTCSTHRR